MGPSGDWEPQVGEGGGDGEPFSSVGGRGSGMGGCSVTQGWSTSIGWVSCCMSDGVALARICTVVTWASREPLRLFGPDTSTAGGGCEASTMGGYGGLTCSFAFVLF